MEKIHWSVGEIINLFLIDSSRQTLFNAEERGEIPKSSRISRGKVQMRQWRIDQLPAIGSRFGFLSKPKSQQVICVYTPKGGVLKTTYGYNLARMLALNGIKTLIVGLDIQRSITNYALPKPMITSLEEFEQFKESSVSSGLFHFLYEKASLQRVIKKTILPTLDIIPETADLNVLEKKLRLENRREYFFKDKLLPYLSDYEVIIFDNSPSWNQLIECALTVSKTVVSPAGCDIETYEALETNLSIVFDFKNVMNLEWENFFLIPTLLENNVLSQEIYSVYVSNYGDKIIPIPIRRSTKGQEARIGSWAVIEYQPKSSLAQDYYELTRALWDKILKGRYNHVA